MNSLIFVPPVKTDFVTCMCIQYWMKRKGIESQLVVKEGYTEFFDYCDIPYLTEREWCGLNISGELSVFFLHAAGFYQYFKSQLKLMLSNNQIKQVRLNFIPEGFGNAMWGEKFTDRIQADFDDISKVKLANIVSYGFKQNYIDKKFPNITKTIVSYDYIKTAIEQNEALTSLSEKAIANLCVEENIIFVPFRPWCTRSFHGGVYDFGSPCELVALVTDMIDRLSDGKKAKVLFRPDFRYREESAFLKDGLARRFELAEVSNALYPGWLSLEPFLYSLLNNAGVKSLDIINFDSTTSIPVFFLTEHSSIESLALMFGCPKVLLENVNGGLDFYRRKLHGKISMFYKHLSPFHFSGRSSEFVGLEQGYFKFISRSTDSSPGS